MATSVFTNPTGRRLTRGLFYEVTQADDTIGVIFTLKDKDLCVGDIVYPSLYRLYMETDDPTEFTFAHKYLEGWEHWQILCGCEWFKPFINRWRWEMELKLKSAAISKLLVESRGEGKNAYNANRFLTEGGWMDKDQKKTPVGRPSRELIKKEAERLNRIEKDITEDYDRLN